ALPSFPTRRSSDLGSLDGGKHRFVAGVLAGAEKQARAKGHSRDDERVRVRQGLHATKLTDSLRQVLLQEQRSIAAVAQSLHRVLDRQPQQLVDLDPRLELAAPYPHHPVAGDLVASAAVDVRGAPERSQKFAPQPGLLSHL